MTSHPIIDFIEARLAEDEQIARNASMPLVGGEREVWTYDREAFAVRATHGRWNVATRRDDPSDSYPISIGDAYGEHIAANQPVRVLREVAAKRALLSIHHGRDSWGHCMGCGVDSEGSLYTAIDDCPILRHVAAVWSDHPDFDPNWSTT